MQRYGESPPTPGEGSDWPATAAAIRAKQTKRGRVRLRGYAIRLGICAAIVGLGLIPATQGLMTGWLPLSLGVAVVGGMLLWWLLRA